MSLPPSAISVVVADAGPLIALGRLDRLALLSALFEQVQVPHVVLAECLLRRDLVDAQRIEAAVEAGALLPCDGPSVEAAGLGAGERAAIGRAQEIGAALLADDQAARACAARLGIVAVGTLGVVVKAHRLGLVPSVPVLIEELRASGHWLSDSAVEQTLAAAKVQS
jgi:predicted nucleic acid-binding protein